MLKQIKGSLFIVFASLCLGSYGVFAKYLSGYGLFYQTYVRCFIIVATLLVLGLATKQLKTIQRKDWKAWAPLLFATIFAITPITIAFRSLPIGTVSFLFYSSFTIFTYILGRILFQEKLTRVKVISACMAFIGLLSIFSIDLSSFILFPVSMAILNGLSASAEVVLSKNLSGKYSTLQITLMVFLAIGITHFAASLLMGEQQSLALFTETGGVITLFSAVSIMGVIALYAGYRELDPSIGALVGLSEIVFGVLFGILLFQEHLNVNTIIGGTLIIVAAALPNLVALHSRRSRISSKAV